MDLYGLLGYPLGHSFSASFFAEKFQREGIDATYRNFEIPAIDALKPLVAAHPELRGLNVTIPYKQAVLPLLDALSEEASAIGAVNVIRLAGGRLIGYNSDVIGFTHSLAPLLQPWHEEALVLGTGGAAKAVVYGLQQLGIVSQSVSRTARAGVWNYEALTPDVMQRYRLIVNCSPVGMFPHTDECPPLPYDALTSRHLLYDLVYNPEETLFLQKGRARGATVKNGLEMLHLQALAAWDIWQQKE